jgi:lipopolysaccharide/colanic/teichoic acid biosynthesis glycosyltransferase
MIIGDNPTESISTKMKLTPYFIEIDKSEYEEQFRRYNENKKKNSAVSNSLYQKYGKRTIDVTVAFVFCIITLPLNLIIALITYFDVGRPIIFSQKRVGKDLKLFTIRKFRNMSNDCDQYGNLLPPEQRVTKIGKLVRASSLDELLQFWNILIGDMSLIGPRPLPTYYLNNYNDDQILRHTVKPGLECPPVFSKTIAGNWVDRFENDLDYVSNISFIVDVRLMIKLACLVLNKKSNNIRKGGSWIEFSKDSIGISDSFKHRDKEVG